MAVSTTMYTEGPFRPPTTERLMIACPYTRTPVDTGYERSSIPAVAIPHLLVDCLECGQDHQWRIEDAFVECY
jgi:hypothetical protein